MRKKIKNFKINSQFDGDDRVAVFQYFVGMSDAAFVNVNGERIATILEIIRVEGNRFFLVTIERVSVDVDAKNFLNARSAFQVNEEAEFGAAKIDDLWGETNKFGF